jgi:hypothetical protein
MVANETPVFSLVWWRSVGKRSAHVGGAVCNLFATDFGPDFLPARGIADRAIHLRGIALTQQARDPFVQVDPSMIVAKPLHPATCARPTQRGIQRRLQLPARDGGR